MGKRQFQKRALQAVQSSTSLSAAGNGIHKKHHHLPPSSSVTNPPNTTTANVSSMHRGRKRRQQALERQQRKQSFIEAELAKIDQIASDKRAAAALAAKRNNKKKHAQSFKALGLDLGQALNQLREHDHQSPALLAAPELDDEKLVKKTSKKQLRHRNWASVVNEERDQMQRVATHDAFVDMGVDALRAHLTNTVMSSSSVAATPNNNTNANTNSSMNKGMAAATAKRAKSHNHKSADVSGGQKNKKRDDHQHNNVDDDEAQAVAAQRRQFKKRQAEQLLEMGAEKRAGVKRQTFGSLLAGVVKKQKEGALPQHTRGRIGDKRPKNLT